MRNTAEEKRRNRGLGAMKGWETRRAEQQRRDNEWTETCFVTGAAEERKRLLPLLERCEDTLDGYSFNFAGENERSEVLELLADLGRELGKCARCGRAKEQTECRRCTQGPGTPSLGASDRELACQGAEGLCCGCAGIKADDSGLT